MCKACACNLLHFKGTLFYTVRTFFGSAVDTVNGAFKSMTSTFPETFFQCYFNPCK